MPTKSKTQPQIHELDLLPSRQYVYDNLPRLDEATLYIRRETVFLILAGLFLGSLTMLNILGITRFIVLASWDPSAGLSWGQVGKYTFAVAVGVLPYPITFLCTDYISELYGRKRATRVVWVGFMLNLWVLLILWIGGALPGFVPNDPITGMPPQPAWNEAKGIYEETGWTFYQVRMLTFGAVFASMIAYLAAQLVDVHVFHFWKKLTNNKHLWLRNNGSTLVSQLVDTTAVILITHFYARALPVNDASPISQQLLLFIVTGYVFKMAAAFADTLPFYFGAHFLARYLRLAPPSHAPHPPAAAAVEAGVG